MYNVAIDESLIAAQGIFASLVIMLLMVHLMIVLQNWAMETELKSMNFIRHRGGFVGSRTRLQPSTAFHFDWSCLLLLNKVAGRRRKQVSRHPVNRLIRLRSLQGPMKAYMSQFSQSSPHGGLICPSHTPYAI